MVRHTSDGLFSYMHGGKEYWGVRLRIDGRLWQRQNFRTKTEARSLRDKIRAEQFEGTFFPDKYQRRNAKGVTIADLLHLVVEDYRRNGRKHPEDATEFQQFWSRFKGTTTASTITGTMLMHWADAWLADGLSPATVNRRMSKLLRGYRLGKDQDPPMVGQIPKWTKLKEAAPRSGFLEWHTFEIIRRELPDYCRVPVTIAFWTGMRYGEIVGLLWSQLTFDDRRQSVRIQLTGQTKNGKPRQVIMPGDLYETLKAWRTATRDVLCRHVCQFAGRQMGLMRVAWKSACIRLGLATGVLHHTEWLRYTGPLIHDLRRTGVRNLIRAGVDRDIAKSISGHLTDSVFSRYNIVNEEDLEEAGRRVSAYIANRADTRTQSMTASMTQGVDGPARVCKLLRNKAGGVTEWPNVPVLKTGVRATGPWVQIPPPPPLFNRLRAMGCSLCLVDTIRCNRKCNARSCERDLGPPRVASHR